MYMYMYFKIFTITSEGVFDALQQTVLNPAVYSWKVLSDTSGMMGSSFMLPLTILMAKDDGVYCVSLKVIISLYSLFINKDF